MSIQEKVARAFCQASCDIKNCPCHYADGDQELKEATAAIKAFLEAAAEQGWRMVPEEMCKKMDKEFRESLNTASNFDLEVMRWPDFYRAMLAAATKFEVGE